jgi:pyruvate/2-oxoglutarate dehydrogenase complex dihydrolipoamide dehydrogenase (E3) component
MATGMNSQSGQAGRHDPSHKECDSIHHDVVVIGGGSAGYAAARAAREDGADVAIVDPGPLGGLCILRGCMPSKTILRSAEIAALMRRSKAFGLSPVDIKADLPAIVDRKDRLVREFARERIEQLRDPSHRLYEAAAKFISPQTIEVGGRLVTARAFIIATGSVPRLVTIPGLDDAGCHTSDELLDVRDQPNSLLILGGGPVALELGQFFSRIGTKVCFIQRGLRLLSHLDEEIGATLEEELRAEGAEVFTGTILREVRRHHGLKSVRFSHQGKDRTVSGEEILAAFGRRPNIDGLNLDAANVTIHEGRISVDSRMRTSQPHIFAVGDVANLIDTTHIAIQQGELAAHNACHLEDSSKQYDDRLETKVVFTDPQVAIVGLSEQACRMRDIPFLTGAYPFADHGKAMCLGSTRGFAKLLASPRTGKLLGAQIVGPQAGELIHELIAVMYYHGTVFDLVRMPHYHPTLAEIVTYPAESLIKQIRSS